MGRCGARRRSASQFWAQRDRIRLFTIASDIDTVPWELLYPVDLDNDNGFLVEQFPVVRRVYGQGRARVLRLDKGAGFIVPPKSPANAMVEVDAVRGILPAGVSTGARSQASPQSLSCSTPCRACSTSPATTRSRMKPGR